MLQKWEDILLGDLPVGECFWSKLDVDPFKAIGSIVGSIIDEDRSSVEVFVMGEDQTSLCWFS